jgi:hypothetical protein
MALAISLAEAAQKVQNAPFINPSLSLPRPRMWLDFIHRTLVWSYIGRNQGGEVSKDFGHYIDSHLALSLVIDCDLFREGNCITMMLQLYPGRSQTRVVTHAERYE